VGEPPLLLGISAWTAVKNAISYAAGEREVARLSLPATPEQILLRLTQLRGGQRSQATAVNSAPEQ
jgi:xanthine dehydrogenase large subunit